MCKWQTFRVLVLIDLLATPELKSQARWTFTIATHDSLLTFHSRSSLSVRLARALRVLVASSSEQCHLACLTSRAGTASYHKLRAESGAKSSETRLELSFIRCRLPIGPSTIEPRSDSYSTYTPACCHRNNSTREIRHHDSY